jgi:MscS family membrane protein
MEATLTASHAGKPISLQQQPFYGELLTTAKIWDDTPISDIATESPKTTILNYYAAMAKIYNEHNRLTESVQDKSGLFWPKQDRDTIKKITKLWDEAIKALDLSDVPVSYQKDMGHETSLKLKQILDYVFNNGQIPLDLPDLAEIKRLNEARLHAVGTWCMPNAAIELTNQIKGNPNNLNYYFSTGTVSKIADIFEDLGDKVNVHEKFATPDFYNFYSSTPGGIVPPLWYLKIPLQLRQNILEKSFFDQTIFQIGATLIAGAVYTWLMVMILTGLQLSNRYDDCFVPSDTATEEACQTSWKRVLLLVASLPLTAFLGILITDYINITGHCLFVINELITVIFFGLAIACSTLLFESLGQSLSIWLAIIRGRRGDLHVRRISNIVMPISRILGALVSMGLLYQLLMKVGLPSSTVFAFSAVPGLAIGLGASKLLGNLFAGLSLQGDRPLRVGEFCRIGSNMGVVSKIGLRAVEIDTLESRISIPNSVADEQTIINYSKRSLNPADLPRQAIDLQISIDEKLSPEQMDDLLFYGEGYLASLPELSSTLVILDTNESNDLLLACHGEVELSDWTRYLKMRDQLRLRLREIIDQVIRSRVVVGVSYDCTEDQLSMVPLLIKGLIDREPLASFRSCRLLAISSFSYDYVFDYRSNQSSFAAFLDELNRINRGVIQVFAAHNIDIPFPTNLEYHKALH